MSKVETSEMTDQELHFLCIETLAQELRAVTGLEINFPQVLEAHMKSEERLLEMLGPVPTEDPDVSQGLVSLRCA